MKKAKEEQNDNIYRHVVLLGQKAGFEGAINLEAMDSGGNNRVFKLSIDEKIFLLKSYFHSDKDPRDRLGHEFAFTSFSWWHGVRAIPQPVVCDQSRFLGLYEFIDGKKIDPEKVTWGHVSQALDFFLGLNKHKKKSSARALPVASEACFSITEHLSCVDRRLKQLREIKPCDATDTEALDFIHSELSPRWEEVRKGVVRFAKDLRIEMDEYIPLEDRCLSPSDFGFHNAILKEDDTLVFIDFEYAGWDDPAKMVCDFFCQPEVPVPLEYFNMFLYEIHIFLNEPECFENRVNLLFPAHKIKWCCIILNDFLVVDNERRKYALNNNDRREIQLNKAREYFGTCIDNHSISATTTN